jgi:NAD(P)-dependent dehydrogenase (short-subunit alcohol dehydrogenase family)
MRLLNQVALITGGTSGIGEATALLFAREGAAVAITGRNETRGHAVTAAILEAGGKAIFLRTDVRKAAECQRAVDETMKSYGRLDVLFNNAGIGAPAIPMEDLSYEQWANVVNVNLTAVFLCAQEAIRIMKSQDPRGGRIINNGSLSAHAPRPNSAPYTSTKHAISGLTKCIALDGRRHDITCSQIDIGNAATPMTERMSDGVLQANGTKAPEPRMDVRHVGDAVLYMANLPLDANVLFMTVMATQMPFVGRG